ncbi:hypothetical protein HanOQP8_Chr17g0673051 [Helianthus annuus]|nr:hypothetical protein HanOQP8_Chr17g0673051 [Helianthus annuus]
MYVNYIYYFAFIIQHIQRPWQGIVFLCHWSKWAADTSPLDQPVYYFISTLKLRFCPQFKITFFSQLKNIITLFKTIVLFF